jgi:hypothetical protein
MWTPKATLAAFLMTSMANFILERVQHHLIARLSDKAAKSLGHASVNSKRSLLVFRAIKGLSINLHLGNSIHFLGCPEPYPIILLED